MSNTHVEYFLLRAAEASKAGKNAAALDNIIKAIRELSQHVDTRTNEIERIAKR